MIRYSLRCADGHGFESWFQSAAAYDRLAAAGHVSCPECGGKQVEKSLMAPAVAPEGRRGAAPGARAAPLATPASEREAALAALRREIEAKSEYVGMTFAAEARRIHEGSAPERSIHGEAKPEEARRLIEDGVPVAPLPFLPPRRTN